MSDPVKRPAKVSDPSGTLSDDDLDQMVERDSRPNLATLFQRGKDAGLIKPGKEYGSST